MKKKICIIIIAIMIIFSFNTYGQEPKTVDETIDLANQYLIDKNDLIQLV